MAVGGDEHMPGDHRVDVEEGGGVLVTVDDAGFRAVEDLAEDAGGHGVIIAPVG